MKVGFVVNQTLFHATREQHVEAILEKGLRTGAPADGILSAPAGEDHNDEFYGIRPVYLLLEPAISSTYQWERWPVEEDEDDHDEPVLLEVDARGLRLLPDLATETASRRPVAASGRYLVLADAGVVESGGGEATASGATLLALQAALSGSDVRALQRVAADALPELRPLLRAQLHYHLGSSQLRTRQVMIEAQALDR